MEPIAIVYLRFQSFHENADKSLGQCEGVLWIEFTEQPQQVKYSSPD